MVFQWLLNIGYLLALTVFSPFLVYKAVTMGKYRLGFWAKFLGNAPRFVDARPRIWIHAVSVGEVLLLRPLLNRLAMSQPDYQVVLSVSTNTGHSVAREKYPTIPVFYAPFDFTWALSRVFHRVRPRLLVLTELELWPNLLLEAKRRGIPVAVVNARIGERSFRGYSRIRYLLGGPLSAIGWWGAQTETMADRIRQLTHGFSTRIEVTGSLKFDGAPTDRNNAATQSLRQLLPPAWRSSDRLAGNENQSVVPRRTIFVAGSTQGDEERIVLDAFINLQRRFEGLRLILVPRHPERFQHVSEILEKSAVGFVRRSQFSDSKLPTAGPDRKVILWDTMGELSALWGLADLGFVGGSLNCGRGGQSMIEPAGFGVPTCFGPEIWNFQEVADKLVGANAAVCLSHADQLLRVLADWLENPHSAATVGENARRFITSQLGATAITAEALAELLSAESTTQHRAA